MYCWETQKVSECLTPRASDQMVRTGLCFLTHIHEDCLHLRPPATVLISMTFGSSFVLSVPGSFKELYGMKFSHLTAAL